MMEIKADLVSKLGLLYWTSSHLAGVRLSSHIQVEIVSSGLDFSLGGCLVTSIIYHSPTLVLHY